MRRWGPIIAIVYFTYSTYLKNIEAASRQAELAQQHVEELSRYITEQERILERYQINYPYLLYAGNIRRHKNIPRLIEAFAVVRERMKDHPTYKHLRLVIIGDTIAPPQHLTAGSWGTATATPAVLKACDAALAQKRSGKQQAIGKTEWLAPGQAPDAMAHAQQGVVAIGGPEFPDFVVFSYIAHFVEVRIDQDLGVLRIARVVSAIDAGRVLNEKTARSQIIGGVVMGIGMATLEETIFDSATGRIANATFGDYLIPVNADVPDIDVAFVGEPDSFSPVGIKGLGEIGVVGVAAAVANAVYHATGRRFRSLPITIDQLL